MLRYLLLIYLTGGIVGAVGLALAGAGTLIATGIAIGIVVLSAGGALALCIHVAGAARLAVERAKWDGRLALLAASNAAVSASAAPRQLGSPVITVDSVVLTQPANVGYYRSE